MEKNKKKKKQCVSLANVKMLNTSVASMENVQIFNASKAILEKYIS